MTKKDDGHLEVDLDVGDQVDLGDVVDDVLLDEVDLGGVDLDGGYVGDVEIPQEIDLTPDTFFDVILDDSLGMEDVVLAVTSESDLQLTGEQPLLLEGTVDVDGEIVIDDVELEFDPSTVEVKAEDMALMLPPSETALMLYPHNQEEAELLDIANREIHEIIYRVDQYAEEADRLVAEYLEEVVIPILPYTPRFSSERYHKEGNFHTLIHKRFFNYCSVGGDNPVGDTIWVIEDIMAQEKFEPLTDSQYDKLHASLTNFFSYSKAVFDEANRKTELMAYKGSAEGTLVVPEVVGNFHYVCKCGEEHPMPGDRPTMTFLLYSSSGGTTARFMNHRIYCHNCDHYLTIPITLADSLAYKVEEYAKAVKGSFDTPRIFRPPITDLLEMIPQDVKELFQLDSELGVSTTIKSNSEYNAAFEGYKRLVSMWMKDVETSHDLSDVIVSKAERLDELNLLGIASRLEFPFLPKLRIHQFTRTMLHFLEGFGLFALTNKRMAFYEFCRIEGLERKPIPADIAIQWLYDNASAVASLNNLFDADYSMNDLDILPEYEEVLNYIGLLHIMSEQENLSDKGPIDKILKKPSSIDKLAEKIVPKKDEPQQYYKNVLTSVRQLEDSIKSYPVNAWSDTYTFIKLVIAPERRSLGLSSDQRALVLEVVRNSEEVFYGQVVNEDLMIPPLLRHKDFMELFIPYGHKLFSGAIVSQKRKHIANLIITFATLENNAKRTQGLKEMITSLTAEEVFGKFIHLPSSFKLQPQIVTAPSEFSIKSTELSEMDKHLLVLSQAMKGADLPSDLNDIRDDQGDQAIMENIDEHLETLMSSELFYSRYKEVLDALSNRVR